MNDRKTFVCEFCGTEYTAKTYLQYMYSDELTECQYNQSHKSPGDCIKVLKALVVELRNRVSRTELYPGKIG